MTDMSRTPASARFSVRGIGVRRQRQDVDLGAELLEPLLVRDAEALLLVDDDQAEVAELDVLRQQPVRADDEVDRAVARARRAPAPARAAETNRDSSRDLDRERPRSAARNVAKCCAASTVVGTSTATCLPSWMALNAARSATSVLP